MPMHATRRLRDRKATDLAGVVILAILLAACTTGSSSSASPDRATGSESASPTDTTTTTEPSQVATHSPSADVTTVTIRDRSFGTPEITVAVGDVTFINDDGLPHTITEGENGASAPNARFDVVIAPGEATQVTFGEPGDYLITCLFHSEMHLLVHAH